MVMTFRARVLVALVAAAVAANVGLAAGAVTGAAAATALDAGFGALIATYLAAVGITLLLERDGTWLRLVRRLTWRRRRGGRHPGRLRS
jgi:fructose-specific phosphotransferase system IIC component